METAKSIPSSLTQAFRLSATLINFTETNPGSGANPDQWGVASQLELGVDIDLQQVFDWNGATIEVRERIFKPKYNETLHFGSNFPATAQGHYWDQDVGSTLASTTFQDFVPTTYLSTFVLRQKTGNMDLRIGRFSPTLEFDQPSNCETLLSCLNPITIYDNQTLPPAIATWGAFATYKLSNSDALKAGISQSDFRQLDSSGFDWSFRSGTGAFLAAEYTHGTPRTATDSGAFFTAGFWHDTSQFTDPLTALPQEGSSAVYGRLEEPLRRGIGRSTTGRPRTYLTAFSSVSYSFSSAQPYEGFVNAGLNLHGLQSKRPADHYGVNVAYLRVRTNELQAERALRLKLSGTSFRSANDQVRVEANAHLALLPTLYIEPSIAYIVNPNVQFATPTARYGPPRNGIVLGFVTFIDIRSLLHSRASSLGP